MYQLHLQQSTRNVVSTTCLIYYRRNCLLRIGGALCASEGKQNPQKRVATLLYFETHKFLILLLKNKTFGWIIMCN
jgi:hypothetical protein